MKHWGGGGVFAPSCFPIDVGFLLVLLQEPSQPQWLTVMDIKLSPIIRWPERNDIWHTMPLCSHLEIKHYYCIDCFEILVERSSNLLARAQTFLSVSLDSWDERQVFYPAGNTTNKLFDMFRENRKNSTYWKDDQGLYSPYKSFPICCFLWVSSSAFVRHLYLCEN